MYATLTRDIQCMVDSPLTSNETLFSRQLAQVRRQRLVAGLVRLYQLNPTAIPGELPNAEMLGRLNHLLASLGGPPEPRRYAPELMPPNPPNILMAENTGRVGAETSAYDGDVSDNESWTSLDYNEAESEFDDDMAQ